MRQRWRGLVVATGLVLGATTAAVGNPPDGPLKKCPADAVVSGTVCMDKYEASVWRVPATNPAGKSNASLVLKVQAGTATEAQLVSGGATPLGVGIEDYAPCTGNGQTDCGDIYAVSLLGVKPSVFITWFQAQQACRNARKRLPTNAEWQAAVAGTPAPAVNNGTTDCDTGFSFPPVASGTGSHSSCVSSAGAFDMVGNVGEWVADWVPRSTGCGTWSAGVSPTGNLQCLAGAETTGEPGALIRGGGYGTDAGPLSVIGYIRPSLQVVDVGFRCAR